MTVPFVSTLRARRESVLLGSQDGETIDIRVEIPEIWDVVRIVAPPSETVLAVKVAALAALDPRGDQRDYVMKLRGFEMLDEQQTLAEAGAKAAASYPEGTYAQSL